jgi:RNA polymerase sigma-70 factor (ECF subfamily)
VSGRLRSWLLSSLQNFLANARRYETRQKRGAGVDVLPLDHGGVLPELEGIAAQGLSAAEAFDRAWVTVLLRRVLELLTLQYERAGKDKELAALLPWLMEEGAVSQAQDAARAGMTPASFRVQLHRLRARYKETLRQEIVATLEREEDYEEELNYLFRLAGQQG